MVHIWFTQWLERGDNEDPDLIILSSSSTAYFSQHSHCSKVLTLASHTEGMAGAVFSQPHD